MIDHKNLILIDAHVHIYDCFELPRFLDSALSNFRAEAERQGNTDQFDAVLLLSESRHDNWFAQTHSHTGTSKMSNVRTSTWTFHLTKEDCSLLAHRNNTGTLTIIAGRQIVTAEDLEVLALCTSSSFEDGLPLRITVDLVRGDGGVPVIPWGAGKWLGKRGAILKHFLETADLGAVFLGDNSGRPKVWSNLTHFRLAHAKGIRILPGTDALPFPSESGRVGSFGFIVPGTISFEHPAQDVKEILLDPSGHPVPYGHSEGIYRFVCNQLTMQLRKRARKIVLKR